MPDVTEEKLERARKFGVDLRELVEAVIADGIPRISIARILATCGVDVAEESGTSNGEFLLGLICYYRDENVKVRMWRS